MRTTPGCEAAQDAAAPLLVVPRGQAGGCEEHPNGAFFPCFAGHDFGQAPEARAYSRARHHLTSVASPVPGLVLLPGLLQRGEG